MGLLVQPPAVVPGPLNAPHQTALTAKRLGDGTCRAGQAVFGATYTGSPPEQLYRWQDPTRVGAFDVVDLPTGTSGAASDACSVVYDSTNNKVYVLLGNPVDDGTNNLLCVASVDPVTLATTMLVDGLAVSTDANSENPNPAICTDGTYIYLLSCASSQNSSVFKLRCSDGGLVASVLLTSPAGGFAATGDVILIEGSFLYCAGTIGGGGHGWAARVATDLSTQTAIQIGATTVNDDAVLTPDGYFWVGSELSSTNGQFTRIAKDMSSTSTFSNGVKGWIDGMLYDGTYIWTSQVADPLAANIVVYDPVGLAVVMWFSLRPGEIHMNEILLVQNNTALWSASYNSSGGSIPSQVVLTPLNSDGTTTPRPVFGRGGT